MTAIVVAVALLYAALIAAQFRFGKAWVNPVFLLLIYYLFNYPLRALLLLQFPESFNTQYSFTDEEILAGLTYSSCYVLLFVGVYALLLKQQRARMDFHGLQQSTLDARLFFVASFLVLLSGAVMIQYELSVAGSFSLGGDIEELRRPFWVNVAALPYSLKWFSICMGILLWLSSRRLPVLAVTALILTMVLLEAFLTTGKGIVAALLLLILFVDNLITGRTFRFSLIVVGTLLVLMFSAYSYYARYAGGVGLETVDEYADVLRQFVDQGVDVGIYDGIERIADRGTYYLDALLLMSRTDASAASGPYVFGSLVELLNLVPRAFGMFSEQYSFDRHVTSAVWGDSAFAEVFIGRVGESFFVLGFAGLLYAVIHACIFAFVATRWSGMSTNIGGIALYFAILQGWLYQDASLVYQTKNLIAILFCYLLAKTLARLSPSGFSSAPVQKASG